MMKVIITIELEGNKLIIQFEEADLLTPLIKLSLDKAFDEIARSGRVASATL